MSDWKNDRAEAEMREGTEQIRLDAEKKAKEKENAMWNELKESLYKGNTETDSAIVFVIDLLREKYELPVKKV